MRRRSSKNAWSQPIADLVGPIIDPVLARRGFSQSDVILFWDEIVGERLAEASQPIKLQWPPRHQGDGSGFCPGALIVRVETGFALELQHLSGVVIERVNAHLGWRCVDRLLLKQGPLERRKPPPSRAPPHPAMAKAAAALVGTIVDDGLREALTRLGAGVLTHEAQQGEV
jgi:hypothetical protein